MHWLGLLVVIAIAGIAAFYLLQRIFDTQQKLASLREEFKQNDLRLQHELTRLKSQSTQQEKPGKMEEEENLEQ